MKVKNLLSTCLFVLSLAQLNSNHAEDSSVYNPTIWQKRAAQQEGKYLVSRPILSKPITNSPVQPQFEVDRSPKSIEVSQQLTAAYEIHLKETRELIGTLKDASPEERKLIKQQIRTRQVEFRQLMQGLSLELYGPKPTATKVEDKVTAGR